MKKFVIVFIATFVAFSSFAAKPRVLRESMHSEILGAEREYVVVLPKSYYKEPEKKYPVLYLLHGMYGVQLDWVDKGNVNVIADLLAARGTAVEMIIVTPNAGGADPKTQQNGYFDMPGWPYEKFFFEEFLPFVEAKYRIIGDKGHRAIAGLSMGGGGSVSYAQHHSDMFCACYAMSAWLKLNDHNNRRPAEGLIEPLQKAVAEHDCIATVQNATEDQKAAWRDILWYVDIGDDDFLLDVNVEFYFTMKAAGIPCQFRVNDGVHNWEYWHTVVYNCLEAISDKFNCK